MAGLHQEGSSLLLPKDKRPIGRQGKETNNLITCLENQERMTKGQMTDSKYMLKGYQKDKSLGRKDSLKDNQIKNAILLITFIL